MHYVKRVSVTAFVLDSNRETFGGFEPKLTNKEQYAFHKVMNDYATLQAWLSTYQGNKEAGIESPFPFKEVKNGKTVAKDEVQEVPEQVRGEAGEVSTGQGDES